MGVSSSTEERTSDRLQRVINYHIDSALPRTVLRMDNRNNNLNISMSSGANSRANISNNTSNFMTGYMAPIASIPPVAPIASIQPIPPIPSILPYNNISIGYDSRASNTGNISIGHSAIAIGGGSIAIGYYDPSSDRQRGVTGASGVRSYSNYLGMTGATGIQTPQSVQGFTGPVGVIGPVGPRGFTGPIGATGAVGATKPIGATSPISSSSSNYINDENQNTSAKTYAELPEKPADGKEVPKLEDPPGGMSISSVPQSEVKQPKIQQSEEPEKLECKICFERPMNIVILPCKHFSTCEECVSSLKECLICRGKIEDTMKVFL